MITFRVVTNAGETADIFEAAVLGVSDYRRPPTVDGVKGVSLWDLVYDVMLDTRRTLFLTKGESEGASWPGYIAAERRYVTVKSRILGWRVTEHDQLRWQPGVRERLFPSVTRNRDRFGIGWRPKERTKTTFDFGSKAPGAENHEFGQGFAPRWAWPNSGRYRIPRRPFLTIGPRTTRKLEQSAIQWAAQFTASIGLKTDAVGAMVLRT